MRENVISYHEKLTYCLAQWKLRRFRTHCKHKQNEWNEQNEQSHWIYMIILYVLFSLMWWIFAYFLFAFAFWWKFVNGLRSFNVEAARNKMKSRARKKKHVAAKKICAHSCCHLWCECFLICDSAHIKISYRLSGLFSAATEYYVCTKSYKWMSRQFWNDENNEIYQQIFEYVYRLALCSLAAIQIRIPFDLFRLFGSNIQNRWYLNT